jgi:broad specificity phosphatase PhoE
VTTTRLFLIRHGETEWTRERRFTGARDLPLSPLGRFQSEAVGVALAERPLAAVWTSPLERARATAEAVAKPHRLELRIAPAFREMAFGHWEGLTRAELAARFPEPTRVWVTTPHLATPPGGETLAQVAERVGEGLEELRRTHEGASVALVTHAIVIRLLVLSGLGLGPERLWAVDASPAGITEIEYTDSWTVVHRMNTRSHLEEPGPEALA